jgi:flagellar assembly protein FliH
MKMSTSYNPAPEAKAKPEPESRPFLYAEVAAEVEVKSKAGSPVPGESIPGTAEILAQREAAAREVGRREGEAQGRAAGEQHLAEIRESVSAALAGFARDRVQYYRQVETEVVQLALAVARKILRREAQVDTLLLAAMVRITLEKMESRTKVVVRVNPEQAADWRGYFTHHMEASQMPDVVEDPAMHSDHCVLQTALGTTEVGVEVQLKEIEQGLLDLLAKRPTAV